jgi:hypothetical protein
MRIATSDKPRIRAAHDTLAPLKIVPLLEDVERKSSQRQT